MLRVLCINVHTLALYTINQTFFEILGWSNVLRIAFMVHYVMDNPVTCLMHLEH